MPNAPGGFDSPNSTQTPDAVFDYWLTRLTGGELRVLLFLIRRTYGWKREQDDVSISQFVHGITDRHGARIAEGTGISRSTAIGAVKKLLAKGLIYKAENRDRVGADEAPTYRLSIRDRRGHPHAGPFSPINTTQVPDAVFDHWLAHLSDCELAVLLYIVRRTIGFGKPADIISPEQFCHGITTRDGTVLDEGCGVSKGKLYPALARLVGLGLITIERRVHPKKGNLPSRFALVFAGGLPSAVRARDPRFADDPTRGDEPLPADADMATGIRLGGTRTEGTESDRRGSNNWVQGMQRADQEGSGKGAKGGRSGQQGSVHKLDPQQTERSQETPGQDNNYQKTQHQQPRSQVGYGSADTDKPAVGVVHDPKLNPYPDEITLAPALTTVAINGHASMGEVPAGVNGRPDAHGTGGCPREDGAHIPQEPTILATEDEIRAYTLADDEVLLDAGERLVQVIPLRAVVCDDIRATRDSYIPVRTDVYYSAAHFLGEEGEWTTDEERKIGQHGALRVELDALYKDIRAFSLEEALGQYFTDDLVRRYASGNQRDRERVQGWLRYVRGEAGAGLTNPAGFLRTRLESAQWAPRGTSDASKAGGRRHL